MAAAAISASIRRDIHRVVTKQYGLSLRMDAVKYLEDILHEFQIPSDQIEATLELIAQTYRKHNDDNLQVVTQEAVELVIARLRNNASAQAPPEVYGPASQNDNRDREGDEEVREDISLPSLVHVVNAFEMPRWRYTPEHRCFFRVKTPSSAFAAAPSKHSVLWDRFELIKQRILRNPHFRPATFTTGMQNDRIFSLTSIASLRGCEGQNFVICGILTRLDGDEHSNKLYLEDPTGAVELVVTNASLSRGFFTETCFVVAEGLYTHERVFSVSAMSMPPSEAREASIEAFGQLDFLGAPADVYDNYRLAQIEKQYQGVCMLFFSDVHLDQPQVMSSLRKLFTGIETSLVPLVIVLCGNFTSVPVSPTVYRECWNAFATMIACYPSLSTHTTWVFVPAKVYAKIDRVVFATNPVRIKYCGQHIVVNRDDLIARMHRNTLVAPTHGAKSAQEIDVNGAGNRVADTARVPAHELPGHLTRTLIDQAHLCPLPLHVHPVMWEYDVALRLYPLPDLVVVADRADRFHEQYEGVNVVNPGAFTLAADWAFIMYTPHNRTVRMSAIPRD